MPARSSRTRSLPFSLRQSERHRAEAKRILDAAGIVTDAQAAPLLGGNWRPLLVPPLAEFVAQTLIVEKETGALIPFALWPEQERALAEIGAHDKLIVPKGRQVGITWLELAAMLHAGTFRGNRLFPIARQSLEYAQDAITRLLLLSGYDPNTNPPLRLPEAIIPPEWQPHIVAKTTMSLTLANGSHYRALTATQQIGRGLAAYWGLADELAFWAWPAQQIAALESGCHRLHIVSTGNGEGDYFHGLWEKAQAGKGEYHPLFIPSTADPRRSSDWYVRNVDEAADPDLAQREHARKPEEAFRAPEGAYFKRFDRERHVRTVEIMPGLPTFRAIDFGFRHPACLWAQQAPSGQLFIVAELLPEDVTTTEFRDAIVATESGWKLAYIPQASYCDPAGKAANVQTAESEFEVLRRARLNPKGKASSVRDGCVRIMDALADKDIPLVVSDACPGLIRALSQVKPHRSRTECYDFDHELYSHPLDALRYLLVNMREGGMFKPPGSGAKRERGSGARIAF
jgi:hypothetical protein